MMSEGTKTPYVRMTEARSRHEHTNGRVIKPFKSEQGASQMFYNNELVSISRVTVLGIEDVYVITGAAYDHRSCTFSLKSRLMDLEKLSKYVKLTGEVVEISSPKTHIFQTKFVSKNDFTSLDGKVIPRGSFITKTSKVRSGGLLDEKIVVEDYPSAIVNNEKLGMFCTVTEPRVEIGVENNE